MTRRITRSLQRGAAGSLLKSLTRVLVVIHTCHALMPCLLEAEGSTILFDDIFALILSNDYSFQFLFVDYFSSTICRNNNNLGYS